jgi:hypothetical protein
MNSHQASAVAAIDQITDIPRISCIFMHIDRQYGGHNGDASSIISIWRSASVELATVGSAFVDASSLFLRCTAGTIYLGEGFAT